MITVESELFTADNGVRPSFWFRWICHACCAADSWLDDERLVAERASAHAAGHLTTEASQ